LGCKSNSIFNYKKVLGVYFWIKALKSRIK
jgi:hypothetical protein